MDNSFRQHSEILSQVPVSLLIHCVFQPYAPACLPMQAPVAAGNRRVEENAMWRQRRAQLAGVLSFGVVLSQTPLLACRMQLASDELTDHSGVRITRQSCC